MNKLIKLIVFSIMVTISLVACNREAFNIESNTESASGSEGTLNLASLKIGVNTGASEVVTRAVNIGDFFIDLYKEGVDEVYMQWKYKDMPEVLSLNVGSYRLEAYSHIPADVAWDIPYYFTSESFDIVKNRYTDIGTMICKLRNIKTSVIFDEALLALMDDATKVTLITNELSTLDFDKTTSTKNGYFKAKNDLNNVIKTTFIGKIDGQDVNYSRIFSNVKAGEHRIFKYSLKDSSGDLGENGKPNFSIKIDLVCETTDETIVVDPGAEDIIGGQENIPTIIGTNFNGSYFDIDASQIIPIDGCTLIVDVNAVDLLTDVEMNIDSETLTPEILKQFGLNTQLSLAVPGENLNGLNELSLPSGNSVIGQSQLSLDFTKFINLINKYGRGTHRLIIKALDNKGQIVTKTLVLLSQDKEVDNNNLPTIIGANLNGLPFDIDKSYVIPAAGCTLIVDINAPKLLTDVEVVIDSQTLTPEILSEVGLTDKFSLAHPGQFEAGLSGLGFPVGTQVIDQSSLQFNISQFTGLLGLYGSAIHKFIIKVTDKDGNIVTKTLTLISESEEDNMPTIIGSDFKGSPFNIDDSLTLPAEGCSLIVGINAPKLLSHVEVVIDSEILTPSELVGVGLIDKFDLAYPGEYEAGLSSLGFPVNEAVIGQSTLQFDLTNFTGLLCGLDPGIHKFIIKVTDKADNIITKTLTLITQ